ncbi:MAG: NnrS family protein [Rhodoplanes sp.]
MIALLWLSAAGGLCATLPGATTAQLGLRLGLAASIGLVMTIGGRVVPSVTASFLDGRGENAPVPRAPPVETLAALGAIVGLVVWVVHPTGPLMTCAGVLAAGTQVLRLAQWRGWTVIGAPAVLIFHLAYAFVPLGFALFAVNASLPRLMPESAALHAWTVGGMGLMTLGIMASMIRRRTGRSFLTSRLGACVFALAVIAAAASCP